jgi:hypothetical protein
MNDVALTLPVDHVAQKRLRGTKSPMSAAGTYVPFALAVAFTFAVVIGLI